MGIMVILQQLPTAMVLPVKLAAILQDGVVCWMFTAGMDLGIHDCISLPCVTCEQRQCADWTSSILGQQVSAVNRAQTSCLVSEQPAHHLRGRSPQLAGLWMSGAPSRVLDWYFCTGWFNWSRLSTVWHCDSAAYVTVCHIFWIFIVQKLKCITTCCHPVLTTLVDRSSN